MFKSLGLIVLSLVGWGSAVAQLGLPSSSRVGAVRPFNEYVLSEWMQKASNQYQSVEGSPFLNQHWEKGTIHTIKDEIFEDVMLKLNLYDGQLIHLNNFTRDSSVIRDDFIWSFSLKHDDSLYTFERFDYSTEKDQGLKAFFIVLHRDSVSLLAKPLVKLQRSTNSALITSTGKQKDRFVHQIQYYILTPAQDLLLLKNSRKAFKEIFGDKHKACRDFAYQRNLDWNKPHDVTTLVQYFNQLP